MGFKFHSRAEMCVTGVHFPPVAGIDYMSAADTKKAARADPAAAAANPEHLACAASIVVSGEYEAGRCSLTVSKPVLKT